MYASTNYLPSALSLLQNSFQTYIPSPRNPPQAFFYQTSPQASVLGKRRGSQNDFMSEGLEKKLKTIIDAENHSSQLNMPSFVYEDMFNARQPLRIPEFPQLQWNQDFQAFPNLNDYIPAQFALQSTEGLIKQSFDLNNYNQDFNLKIEHSQEKAKQHVKSLKIESLEQETECSQDSTSVSDNSESKEQNVTGKLKLKIKNQKNLMREQKRKASLESPPALSDFTSAFPEWDLATIFDFVNLGKSREEFEVLRKDKITRKIQSAKLRSAKRRARQQKALKKQEEAIMKRGKAAAAE